MSSRTLSFPGPWCAGYIRERLAPEFRGFRDVVLQRVLPVFDTIGEEIRTLERDRFRAYVKEIGAVPDGQVADAGEFCAAKADGDASALAETLVGMYHATVGVYCVGLHHLFEQEMADLVVRILQGYPRRIADRYRLRGEIKLQAVACCFKAIARIPIESLPSWPAVEELRLVANTVKHAEGSSAAKLKGRRPDLFVDPILGWGPVGRLTRPLHGEDFYLEKDHFSGYAEGILTFWAELADRMERVRSFDAQ